MLRRGLAGGRRVILSCQVPDLSSRRSCMEGNKWLSTSRTSRRFPNESWLVASDETSWDKSQFRYFYCKMYEQFSAPGLEAFFCADCEDHYSWPKTRPLSPASSFSLSSAVDLPWHFCLAPNLKQQRAHASSAEWEGRSKTAKIYVEAQEKNGRWTVMISWEFVSSAMRRGSHPAPLRLQRRSILVKLQSVDVVTTPARLLCHVLLLHQGQLWEQLLFELQPMPSVKVLEDTIRNSRKWTILDLEHLEVCISVGIAWTTGRMLWKSPNVQFKIFLKTSLLLGRLGLTTNYRLILM